MLHRPVATGGISGPCPPKSLLVPPKREMCLPKRRLCHKESNRLGASGVQLGALDPPQNTGHHPRIRRQEPFFADFAIKTLFFGLHPKFRGISHKFRDEDLCFGLHPRIRGKSFCTPQKLFMPP